MSRPGDILERISRLVTLMALAIAAVGIILAPLISLSWAKQPFPGFLMDHTLVVTDQSGPGWTGYEAGVGFGQRITRIAGQSVSSDAQYRQVLQALSFGDVVSISTQLREGGEKFFPGVELTAFSQVDLSRLFWLPYLMGLAYLAIGIWVYRARGSARPGRALSFFCFAAAVAMAFYFDVFSSHWATPLWAVAIASLGGSLLSLAMRFPQEAGMVRRHPAMLGLPYVISVALGAWAALSLFDSTRPWEYLVARDVTYRYAGFGAVIFLATTLFRALQSREAVVRRQARIMLLGSTISFGPLIVWLMTPLVGLRLHFEPVLYMPWLVIFPLGVAVAIFRYRLLEMDAIVNRTILWGTLTAILAGILSVSISILQRFFQSVTGERSDVAIVLTSFILVSVFTPVKTWLQAFLDRRFRDSPDHVRALRDFGHEVRSHTQLADAQLMTKRLLEEAAISMEAESGVLRMAGDGGRLQTVHMYGDWRGEAWLAAPLEHGGERFGLLLLGPRRGNRSYSREEFGALQQAAHEVAHALTVSRERAGDPVRGLTT